MCTFNNWVNSDPASVIQELIGELDVFRKKEKIERERCVTSAREKECLTKYICENRQIVKKKKKSEHESAWCLVSSESNE
ncbi:hypothetical protein WH47_08960 [Habropoda laboriosa]|uniref:Uncharacterized protein n=1 Tax=Habropoda laboriosa TaxID=597456 RepID=A0A0L7R6P9_9HYME|nr:hypothetical protein WH47_08960 [Habropoda laboriosa]